MEFQPIETSGPVRRRIATAMGASVALHLVALAVFMSLPRPPAIETPIVVFPVSLVGGGGGGDTGDGGDAGNPARVPSPPAPAPVAETVPKPAPEPVPVARPKVTKPPTRPRAEPAPSAVASVPANGARGGGPAPSAEGTGTGGGGGGGSGGGFSGASAAYGVNPEPPYPMVARRLGLEGTVVLRVVVGPDGAPTRVEILQSSGHASLDTSAADTVRTRWRFVPARRNGIPIEDSVQVPIRFHQTPG